ncbi:MAG TPA: hypothetical protein VFN10_23980 [Thermoanaerobaculia bacterium]|nr:hypothetical protein [Thermoanaerobaculia bacterium]
MARKVHTFATGVIAIIAAVTAVAAALITWLTPRSKRRDPANTAELVAEPFAGAEAPPLQPNPPDAFEVARAEDLAKSYRDQFAKGVATTTLAIFGAATTLTVLFVNQIAPVAGTVGEVVAAQWAAHAAAKEWQQARDRMRSFNPKSQKKAHDAAKLRLQFETTNQKAKRQSVTAARSHLEKLKTPLGDLNLPDDAGPFVWSMSLAGILIYVHRRRLLLTAMALQVVHLYRDRLHKPIHALDGLGAWAPFWLAPLPAVEGDGSRLDEEGLRDGLLRFLGWRSDEARRTRLTVLCLIAIALTWLFVLVVAIAYATFAEGSRSFWAGWSLLVIPIATLLAFHVPWRQKMLPTGEFPERVERLSDQVARRHFLQAAGVLSLGVIGYNVYQAVPRSLRYLAGVRWPRHRQKKKKKPLAIRNAIVVNPKSRILNYVRADGLALGGIQLPAAKVAGMSDFMAAIHSPQDRRSLRFSSSRGPLIVEMVAVDLATKGNVPLAMQFILDYLTEYRTTPIRLFNLLAALIAKERSPQHLAALQDIFERRKQLREGLLERTHAEHDALALALFKRIGKGAKKHWKGDRFVWTVPYPPRTIAAKTRATVR